MSRSHRWTDALVIAALVALCACKGKGTGTVEEQSQTGSGSGSGSLSGWERIEALATPTVAAGQATALERAMALARANGKEWRELKYSQPPPAITAYPKGVDAIEALHAWAAAKGGLPAIPKPTGLGFIAMEMHDVGTIAIASATDAKAAQLEDALYLATRLVAEGRNFLEVQMGFTTFGDVRRKLRALAIAGGGSADLPPVPSVDLVRILAAEALQSRRTMDYATTPEGRKDLVDLTKAMPEDSKNLVEDVVGKRVEALIPTDEEAVAFRQFWLVALEGAQRGEPAQTTIDRVAKAVERAPGPAQGNAGPIASMLSMLKSSADRLSDPDAY